MTTVALATITTPANTINLDAMLADFASFIDVKEASLRTYLNGIRQFFSFTQAQGTTAGRETLAAWREELKAQHKATTIATYLIAVKRFVSWASANGYLPAAIAEGMKSVKSVKIARTFKRDCLTQAQAQELLQSIDTTSLAGKRDFAMLALMLTAGLRDIEVARATIGDITTIAGQSALAVHGKGKDEADAFIKIAPKVEKAIRQYLANRNEHDPKAPLFASTSNRNAANSPMTTRSISRIVKTALQKIGLDSDRITSHSLRHTAATMNLLNGGSLEETQQLLRHANIATTMIYSHHLNWQKRQAENRIADALL